jgi:ribonuclease HII
MKLTIKEIKVKLQTIEEIDDPFLTLCQEDERKGVQTALKQWYKKYDAKQALKAHYHKMNFYENEGREKGFSYIAGVDEVGRGPLAGPVVSAAVILDPEKPIFGLDDSKKLSLKKRNKLFAAIKDKALAIGISAVNAEEIDQLNILQASKLSMVRAVEKLTVEPHAVLVDAETINIPFPQKSIVQGDAKSNSIAAASIIAKVTRDKLMEEYDEMYSGYGFSSNVGYGTKEHLSGLEKNGPSPIHRKTFSPVSKYFK